jgi:hypothetical protein
MIVLKTALPPVQGKEEEDGGMVADAFTVHVSNIFVTACGMSSSITCPEYYGLSSRSSCNGMATSVSP